MFNYFTSVYIHGPYSLVYIYIVPVSENFIVTMMIKLEVMMSMRRMTVTMTDGDGLYLKDDEDYEGDED